MAEKRAKSEKPKRKPKKAAEPPKSEAVTVQLDVTKTKAWSGSEDLNFCGALVDQIASSVFKPAWKSEAAQMREIRAALAAMAGLAPRDELEGMMAAQMVATHTGAMECLRRAMLPDQSFEGRDVNMKHAAKLMSLYTQQVAALDKHRGGGRQKITVEHVTVEAGGQAIVGHVSHGSGSEPKQAKSSKAALANNPDPVIDTTGIETGQKRREKAPASRASGRHKSDEPS